MFHRPLHPLRHALVAAAIVAAVPFSASAAVPAHTPSKTEQMLSAAGFQAVPANTAERQTDMAKLPRRRVIAQPNGDSFTYVYADPTGCGCLYLGGDSQYQSYQKLSQDRAIAEQNAEAANTYRLRHLNWDLWGPYGGWGLQGSMLPRGGFGGHARGSLGGAGQHDGSGHR
jgi:hypothetical protein